MNDELQMTSKKAIIIISRNYPFICLEGLNNAAKQISNDNRCELGIFRIQDQRNTAATTNLVLLLDNNRLRHYFRCTNCLM